MSEQPNEQPLTRAECQQAEAIFAALVEETEVPQRDELSAAGERAEGQWRILGGERQLRSVYASLSMDERLPPEQARLVQRWKLQVELPGVVLASLLGGLVTAQTHEEAQAIVESARQLWEDGRISAADVYALRLLAEEESS